MSINSIGFIGLGAMGGGMARNLVLKGHKLSVFDLDEAKRAAFTTFGATEACSARSLAEQSDLLFLSLPHAYALYGVLENDILPATRPGQFILELGTSSPPRLRAWSERFAAQGATFMDAPVSGGPDGAARGDLRIFVGGTENDFQRVRPFLEAIGQADLIVHCGPVGAGMVVKGVNNMVLHNLAPMLMESLSFGIQAGIDPDVLLSAVGDRGGNDLKRILFTRTWEKFYGPNATGRDACLLSEWGYYLEEADDKGIPMPATRALKEFCGEWKADYTVRSIDSKFNFWQKLMGPRL